MSTMHNQAFSLFGQPVYWYGVIIAAGMLAAVVTAWSREKRLGLSKDTTLNLALIILPVGLIFARAYYVAFSWSEYRANPLDVFNTRQGGMAIYGGLIGGALAVFVYGRAKKIPFLKLADLIAPALALAQGIGRWGNFMNQEAYGIAVQNPALQFFPVSVFIEADSMFHYATFFYESMWCLVIFGAILTLEKFHLIKRVGDGFLMYVLLYAAERAVVEGLRTDSLMMLNIRVSQLVSIVALGCTVLVLAARLIRTGKRRIGFLSLSLALLLLTAMLLTASLQLPGLPYLLLFAAMSLLLGLFLYHQLPSLRP